MAITMQQKRGPASNWTSSNPILLAGEIGFETDTNKMKVGDGTNSWTNLPYIEANDELMSAGNNDMSSSISIENATIIDSVTAFQWRSLKYAITMAKNTGGTNKFASTELTILIDNSNVSVSEYGEIDNNGDVGTVSVSQTGGTVNITVTPNLLVKPITVRYYRTGLKA
jgi:hypothetical protein